MHLEKSTAEHDPAILLSFIRKNPLGLLTTAIKSPSYPLLQTSHIPWIIDVPETSADSSLGTLRGHLARQNPQSKAMIESLSSKLTPDGAPETNLEEDVLILFNGPVHHYITPHFYRQTKPATGKTVPTWDYEAVEVYGRAKIYHDRHSPASAEFLGTQIHDLSVHAERSIMGYGEGGEGDVKAWKVSDAPEPYIKILTTNIIGIEVEIKSIAGRFKMSQEKPHGDRVGIVDGFRGMESPVAAQMAEIVAHRASLFDARKEQKEVV